MNQIELMNNDTDTYMLRLLNINYDTVNILEIYDNYIKAFEYDKYHFILYMKSEEYSLSDILSNVNFTNVYIKSFITNIYKNNKCIIDDINKIRLNDYNVQDLISILKHNNNNITFEFIKLLKLNDNDWLLLSSNIVLTFEFARKFKKNIKWHHINYIKKIENIEIMENMDMMDDLANIEHFDFNNLFNCNNYTTEFYIEFQKYIPANVFKHNVKNTWYR